MWYFSSLIEIVHKVSKLFFKQEQIVMEIKSWLSWCDFIKPEQKTLVLLENA